MKGAVQFTHLAASGIRYHGLEIGKGQPLIFLHGFTGCSAAHPGFLSLLACDFKVFSIDLPGHGKTKLPKSSRANFSIVVQDLADVLSFLVREKAPCVGYSMGGRIALALACMHTGTLGPLSLIGASPGIANPKARLRRLAWDQELANYIKEVPKGVFWDYWSKLPLFSNDRPKPLGSLRDPFNNSSDAGNLARSLSILGTGAQPSYWDCLPDLKLPVQLIVGCQDLKFAQVAIDMESMLANSKVDLIEGANHRVHVDQPVAVATKITAHISKLQERPRTK